MKLGHFFLAGLIGLTAGSAHADKLGIGTTCFGLETFVPPVIAGTPMEKQVSCGNFSEGPKSEWNRTLVAEGGPSSRVTLTIVRSTFPVAAWGDLSQNAKAATQNEQVIATLKQAAGADPKSVAPMIATLENTRYFTVARQYDSMVMWDKEKSRATLSIYISATAMVQAEYPAASPDEAIAIAKDLYQKGAMAGLASFVPK
ncbi:hypothetical protein [Dyella flagellata]|uniref:Uncharacterized protein n=1 Tax=Dyella flagellata TaxID=1867833 RepID=A0ABQ5XHV6_9GAMM|nr:hypothetical protein [Dyella flagellata]GLQ90781.1 hypothetical protein GCM10007898_43570 [Dyella flagellata]